MGRRVFYAAVQCGRCRQMISDLEPHWKERANRAHPECVRADVRSWDFGRLPAFLSPIVFDSCPVGPCHGCGVLAGGPSTLQALEDGAWRTYHRTCWADRRALLVGVAMV